MSSSISSSESEWRRFALRFAEAAAAALVAVVGLLAALDPYDTGRFALLPIHGVPEQGPRTAHASRARDPAFDGAILGNSNLQLVSPEMLSAASGVAFVSLTVPGSGPKEQLAILDYFLRHRARPPRAIVLGLDGSWCTDDPALANRRPFPFWLYDPDPLAYLAGLVRYGNLEEAVHRLQYGLGRRAGARPDGYWDYEKHRAWRREVVEPLLASPMDTTPWNRGSRFPAFEALARRLSVLPGVPVVLVRPPVFVTALPGPEGPLARPEADCLAATRSVVDGRPGTALVDRRFDAPENRAIVNYFDHMHYRAPLARELERLIASAIAQL